MLPNEAVMSGFEKLKSMLGSTPADVDAKEPGLEYCPSPILLVANDATGAGEDTWWSA
jgi:hypothetical protein